jgi:hypothetical protein
MRCDFIFLASAATVLLSKLLKLTYSIASTAMKQAHGVLGYRADGFCVSRKTPGMIREKKLLIYFHNIFFQHTQAASA